MKFQVSAKWIWGYTFEIAYSDIVSLSTPDKETYINDYAKNSMISFFKYHNLLDIVDYVTKIPRFHIHSVEDLNANIDETIYICYCE